MAGPLPLLQMMLFGDATGFVYEWSNDENAQATMEGILLEPLPLPPVIPAVTITDNTCVPSPPRRRQLPL